MSNSVSLHRIFTASPEKVFRAFTTPDAMAHWLPPYGFLCQVQEMDVKLGGRFHMSFTNFTTENSHGFGGEYLEMIPNERLVYDDRAQKSTLWDRTSSNASRNSRNDSCRDVLSRMARIARKTQKTR